MKAAQKEFLGEPLTVDEMLVLFPEVGREALDREHAAWSYFIGNDGQLYRRMAMILFSRWNPNAEMIYSNLGLGPVRVCWEPIIRPDDLAPWVTL